MNGFLFDGFPHNLAQAQALDDGGVEIDYVVDTAVDDEEIIKRLSGRRVHPASGRVYHLLFNRPEVEGKDNETGEDLIQRDDRQETVRKRLQVYHEQTEPLIEYYSKLAAERGAAAYVRIKGNGPVEQIRDRIFAALG